MKKSLCIIIWNSKTLETNQEPIKKGHGFEQTMEQSPSGELWNCKKERGRNLYVQTLGRFPG